MEIGIVVSLIAIFILIVLSAFFSGSETALTATSQARMHTAEREGDKRAALVNRILAKKDKMIGALLLGNNVVNISASALATGTLIKLFGEAGMIYASAVMTAIILVFSEVMPKTYAFYRADKLAKIVAPVVNIVIFVFAPITEIIARIVRSILKFFGADISKTDHGCHLEVLRGVIEMHQGPEKETQKQRAMLRSVLDLADVTVDEVMIHRQNVIMVNADLPQAQIVDAILNSHYSRMPLWRDKPENIVGIVHTKWLLRELRAVKNDMNKIDIETIIAEPWFIPETTNLYDQLQAFKSRGEHFSFIVDEYGSFQGILTLEDILEEIVGEINDEQDRHVPGVRIVPNGTYLVNGTVTIRDLRREFDWDLPDEDYSTVAGLLLYETRQVPEIGQSFRFFGYKFDILRKSRNQITLVRITPPPKEESSEASLP
jgi:Mg2+/Co2+ transporter CorB